MSPNLNDGKICTKCKTYKSFDNFYNRKEKKDGKNSSCKECENHQIKIWRKNNKPKQAKIERRNRLKHYYGLSEDLYYQLLVDQNHSCAICARHQDELDRRLAVDHDHFTGEIRGLLCTYCNHKILGKHVTADYLRKLLNYVESGTGLFIPEK